MAQPMRLDDQLARALGWAGIGLGITYLVGRRREGERAPAVRRAVERSSAIHLRESVAVQKPPEDLYRFWREPERVPLVVPQLLSVSRIDDRRWRWVARGPAGEKVEWESEIVSDQPNRSLAWRERQDGAPVNEGRIRFEPQSGGRGTLVTFELDYAPATTAARRPLQARMLGGTERQLKEDLRRFRQLMEAGEVATTAGQPTGRRSLFSRALP